MTFVFLFPKEYGIIFTPKIYSPRKKRKIELTYLGYQFFFSFWNIYTMKFHKIAKLK